MKTIKLELDKNYNITIGSFTGKECWALTDSCIVIATISGEKYELRQSMKSLEWFWVKTDKDKGYSTQPYRHNNEYVFLNGKETLDDVKKDFYENNNPTEWPQGKFTVPPCNHK